MVLDVVLSPKTIPQRAVGHPGEVLASYRMTSNDRKLECDGDATHGDHGTSDDGRLMVPGSRHATKYVVPLRFRGYDANLLCPSQLRFPTLASWPCCSCSSVLPSRPKNGGQRCIRKPAAARHCCPMSATPSIQYQMSDVQARHEPLSGLHTHVSFTPLRVRGARGSGQQQQDSSEGNFGHLWSVT